MYKGLSPGLAAIMGLAVSGATTAEAAPFTGHDVTINIATANGPVFLSKTTTVADDPFNPEITSADDSFFDVNDFLDIGADSITLFSDGITGGSGLIDVDIDFTGSTNIDFTNFTVAFSGSISGSVQILSERILLEDVFWNAGYITISGIEATTEASSGVPEPGALAGLGVGLMGMAGAGAARRRKKVTDKNSE